MTTKVFLGGKGLTKRISIGGDSPVSLQTMWKDSITDIPFNSEKLEKTLKQINEIQMLGCDIVRFAVPDMESAKGLCMIAERTLW